MKLKILYILVFVLGYSGAPIAEDNCDLGMVDSETTKLLGNQTTIPFYGPQLPPNVMDSLPPIYLSAQQNPSSLGNNPQLSAAAAAACDLPPSTLSTKVLENQPATGPLAAKTASKPTKSPPLTPEGPPLPNQWHFDRKEITAHFPPFNLGRILFPKAAGRQGCIDFIKKECVAHRRLEMLKSALNQRLNTLDNNVLYKDVSIADAYKKDKVTIGVILEALPRIQEAVVAIVASPWFFPMFVPDLEDKYTLSKFPKEGVALLNNETDLPSAFRKDKNFIRWGTQIEQFRGEGTQLFNNAWKRVYSLADTLGKVVDQLAAIAEVQFWTGHPWFGTHYQDIIKDSRVEFHKIGRKLDKAKRQGRIPNEYERGIQDVAYRCIIYSLINTIYQDLIELNPGGNKSSKLPRFHTSNYYYTAIQIDLPGFYVEPISVTTRKALSSMLQRR